MQHDYPQECRPGGVRGNFIMFASATSGDRDNNNQFSHCSKSNISAVLDAIAEGRKPNCFTESDGAFCGNKVSTTGWGLGRELLGPKPGPGFSFLGQGQARAF